MEQFYFDVNAVLMSSRRICVEAVDTLGAGDSFATAFLLSFLESRKKYGIQMKESIYEKEIRKALEAGAEFSSKTCMVQGAFGHGKSF